MSVIDPELSLGELVEKYPDLAREFERHGLDYCCGGGRTLAEASAARGLDLPALLATMGTAAVATAPAVWSGLDAAALCDYLETTHHAFLWDELPRLSALIQKIESVHGARHPELAEVARCYAEIRADLEPHLVKEEQVLFPMVRQLASATDVPSFHCGTLRNPISVMLREHDAVGDLLARLRTLTNGYVAPADGCATYQACYRGLAQMEEDTHLHIHKENNVLFPMVVRMEAARASGLST